MLQENVKTTKKSKTSFFFAEKDELGTQQLLLVLPFQSTNYRKEELYVDNKVEETNGDVFCPTCRSEKCVYISASKRNILHDCKKCKACCHVLNFPFKDQKSTFMLLGGDGTHCFARKTSHDYKKEKPSRFLKNFLCQSQSNTSETDPKMAEYIPFMA